MKEFTLLITILFNFPNGEHQEIQVERKQMSEVDCRAELEKQDDVAINLFGNTIDLFFECTPSIEDDTYKYEYDYRMDEKTLQDILIKKGGANI
jgi:Mg2+ and Co2+ transporter CorA|tara:strand:+ start:323 stop:604 length:282 start_codon:yes stop_codon:yes gene_type:complete